MHRKKLGGREGVNEMGNSKPVFAFSIGVPSAMILGIGGILGRAEDKNLNTELRGKLGMR
jgi:hypothetical protein